MVMSHRRLDFSSVTEFYAGKSIFITGGTGFLGKILIEKLLYSCNIEKIYVLIRNKRGESLESRMATLLENEIFHRVRDEKPENLKKVIPIVGDLHATLFGLSEDDQNTLFDNVSVVFHAAATLRFNETLKTAMAINVSGTQELLDLCHRMKNLQAVVHLSTAFSNTDKSIVEEVVYPPPATIREVYTYLEERGDDKEAIKELLKGRPNTYAFTKALAEHVVQENRGLLPMAIVRPSIVTAADKEPLEGWLCNWNGPTGLLLAVTKGFFRFSWGVGSYRCDIIPADIVTNMTIVAAARCQRSKDLEVYNCCSGPGNPISLEKMSKMMNAAAVKRGLNDFPYPHAFISPSVWLVLLLRFLFSYLPALFIDLWRKMLGKRPKYIKMLNQLEIAEEVLYFFKVNEWEFRDGNVRELISSMSPADRETFNCDVTRVDWTKYLVKYLLGIHKYLLRRDTKSSS